MIVPMIKYSFLVYHSDYNAFLKELKRIGVVHIQKKQKEPSSEMQELYRKISELKRTIKNLETIKNKTEKQPPKRIFTDGEKVLARIYKLENAMENIRQQTSILEKEEKSLEPWGDFSLEHLHQLEKEGFTFRFLTISSSKYREEWEYEHFIRSVGDFGGRHYFVLIETDKDKTRQIELPNTEEIKLPDKSLTQIRTEIINNRNREKVLHAVMNSIAHYETDCLLKYLKKYTEEVEELNVLRQTTEEAEGTVSLVEGWTPEANTQELDDYLEKNNILYLTQQPEEGDEVPVLLKNNRFARLFEPIGEMYDFPKFQSLDLTPFFAPFFMLFFGICLGDTGYGLLILIAVLFARKKVAPSLKPILSLAAVLASATVVCGFFCGTVFGIPLLKMEWTWLTSLKKVMLDSDQLFNVALILGGVQILFGMFVKAYGIIRRYGWAYSLETWGWLILFIGGGIVYLASDKELLSPDMSRYLAIGVLSIAGLFIFILNTPGRNPLINFGAGLWNTFNMATGLIGDLLSYIRLFALGLCSGVMGFVFNELAMELSGDIPLVSQLVMVIILLVGHSLNIFMSCLGSFVHPMRLTFVEFYKNAGFQGGGKKYMPYC